MGQLRSAVRALAGAGLRTGGGHRATSTRSSSSRGGQYATLAYAEVDPDSGEVTLAAAGHLPPALIGAGEPRLFLGGRSTPLGIPLPRLPRTEATFTLAPGAGFVLYTDGLVERRTETHRRRPGTPARRDPDRGRARSELVDALLEAGAIEDDVCILVFRRT